MPAFKLVTYYTELTYEAYPHYQIKFGKIGIDIDPSEYLSLANASDDELQEFYINKIKEIGDDEFNESLRQYIFDIAMEV